MSFWCCAAEDDQPQTEEETTDTTTTTSTNKITKTPAATNPDDPLVDFLFDPSSDTSKILKFKTPTTEPQRTDES